MISHLFFADVLILFSVASSQQAGVMENIVSHFCQIFGQKISTAKSRLFVLPDVRSGVSQPLSLTFDIRLTLDLGKYFGSTSSS